MRVVGFDLDLTLVDTRARILACASGAFGDVGADVPEEAIVPLLGFPLTVKAQQLAPDVDAEAFVSAYRSRYRAPGGPACPAMPGAREALEAVVARGGRAVVVSAKLDALVDAALVEAGLRDLVAAVHGDLFGPAKATALRAEGASAYVGDHPADMEAARTAQAYGVAVATGTEDAAALRAAGADTVLDSLSEFPAWYAGWPDGAITSAGR